MRFPTNKVYKENRIGEMTAFYEESKNMRKTANYFGVGHMTAHRMLVAAGINVVDCRSSSKHNKRYDVNEYYFEKVDSRDKAYILGLIFSDGCINSNSRQIRLKLTDIELVEAVKSKIGYTGKLHIEDATIERKKKASLIICNKKMYDDIQALGIRKQKTFDCEYPSCLNGYDADFLRGYFDGDGCISVGVIKKDNRLFSEVKIIGTERFVQGAILILRENGIYATMDEDNRIIKSKGIRNLRIRRLRDVLRFREFIYKDIQGQMFLCRKYEKFKQVKIRREAMCL